LLALHSWWRRLRHRRTPLYMQLEGTDCGAACLGIVLSHYGCWQSLEQLRQVCHVGRDGSNLEDVALAARKYGMTAIGRSSQIEQLSKLPLPMILFWGFNHFVVLERIDGGRFYLNDPAQGHRVVGANIFNRDYTGVGLVLEPGPDFSPTRKPPGVIRRLWPWLREHRSLMVRTAAYGLLLALVSLALPILLALFVDRVLMADQPKLSLPLFAAMLTVGGLTWLLTWLQLRSLRELVLRLSISQSDRYLDRLLRLPVRFFAHRFAGDLAMRMRLIDQVAEIGAGQLGRLAVDLVMGAAFLAAMLYLDALLALAVAGLGVLCVLMTRALTGLRRDHNHRLRREQSMLVGTGAAGLKMIESLQATGRENDFFSRWSGRQARELDARQEFAELGHVAASLPGLFHILTAALVFGLGGWRLMAGEMTIGSMVGFYILAGNFISPVARIAQFSDLLETLEADLARMDDVLDAPQDTVPNPDYSASWQPGVVALDGSLRLIGRLEIRDATFGFQRNRPPLIEDFNLLVEPGQRVAIVGPSGSGKSTLALLAAGQHQLWSGEILYDGRLLAEIPREVFRRSVAIVDQHPFLFAASIRDNLTMWDTTAPDQFLTVAAQDAAIHNEIMSRPAGYEANVEEGGRNFSGGQRQRLEIARALVNNPSMLILDEATSALDANTELLIDDRIRRRGCSCLIIAHRLSTIRDADRIIVMERGRIIEEGTHEELYVEGSIYSRFIHGE